jgi:hypothetical protein
MGWYDTFESISQNHKEHSPARSLRSLETQSRRERPNRKDKIIKIQGLNKKPELLNERVSLRLSVSARKQL